MIARPVLGAHICLRCELQLLKQLNGGLRASQSPQARRSFARRHLHNEASPVTPLAAEPEEPAQVTSPPPRDPKQTQTNVDVIHEYFVKPQNPSWTVSHRPLGKTYGFKGFELRESRRQLEVGALGEESQVLVLKPADLMYTSMEEMEEMAAGEKVDIISRVDEERGLASLEEILSNLESIRPKEQVLSPEEFKGIEDQLQGFTRWQINTYIKKHDEKMQERSLKEKPDDAKIRTGANASKWMPGTSETPAKFELSPLRGYVSAAHTPKHRLALYCMRHCWEVEDSGVNESLGEIELHIDTPAHVAVLRKGRNPPLKSISETLISTTDEKIEVFPDRHKIRISAPKAKAEVIAQKIQEYVSKVMREEIDLSPLRSPGQGPKTRIGEYADREITQLARITDTIIKPLSQSKIEVYYIDQPSGPGLSSKADLVRKHLLSTSIVSSGDTRQVNIVDTDDALSAVKYEATETKTWRTAFYSWVRWIVPVTKESLSTDEKKKKKRKGAKKTAKVKSNAESIDKLKLLTHFPVERSARQVHEEVLANTLLDTNQSARWDRKYFTTTSVTVGHIVHRVKQDIGITSEPGNGLTKFIPTRLNVSKLLGGRNVEHLITRASVHMRFRPSPWTSTGAAALKKYPPLEMRFDINPETQVLELKDLFAIAETSASDIMVPNRGLDLRFLQRTTSRLRSSNYAALPQIREFLDLSWLNISQGTPVIKTPPGLTLPIARHLIASEATATSKKKENPPTTESADETADETVDVPYLYTDIECRNVVSAQFEDWRLLYTSITSDEEGSPPRAELSLRPRPADESAPAETPEQTSLSDSTSTSDSQGTIDSPTTVANPKKEAATLAKLTRKFIASAYSLIDKLDGTESSLVVRRMESTPVRRMRAVQGEEDWDDRGEEYKFGYFMRTLTLDGPPKGRRRDEVVTDRAVEEKI